MQITSRFGNKIYDRVLKLCSERDFGANELETTAEKLIKILFASRYKLKNLFR